MLLVWFTEGGLARVTHGFPEATASFWGACDLLDSCLVIQGVKETVALSTTKMLFTHSAFLLPLICYVSFLFRSH